MPQDKIALIRQTVAERPDLVAAMVRVMALRPDLTLLGLGDPRDPDFMERRADLLYPDSVLEFEYAREWLRLVHRSKVSNKNSYSYGIKHAIERWVDPSTGYVSNGACIAAAIDLGIEIEPDGINAWFAIAGPKHWPKGSRQRQPGDRVIA